MCVGDKATMQRVVSRARDTLVDRLPLAIIEWRE
jgi:hypothetical protein